MDKVASTRDAVVPAKRVQVVRDLARIGTSHDAGHGEPTIELFKEGDAIQAIEIVCSCGKRIRLRCVYG